MAKNALIAVLPEVFQVTVSQSPPLAALAAVAEDLHAPVIETLNHLETVIDPFRCPENLVAYLAAWVDLGWLTIPDGGAAPATGQTGDGASLVARPALVGGSERLRDLIAESSDLSARRGTVAGLTRFLMLATGIGGFAIEATAEPFHVRVRVPAAAVHQRSMIDRIVATMKPAHVTAEIVDDEIVDDAIVDDEVAGA